MFRGRAESQTLDLDQNAYGIWDSLVFCVDWDSFWLAVCWCCTNCSIFSMPKPPTSVWKRDECTFSFSDLPLLVHLNSIQLLLWWKGCYSVYSPSLSILFVLILFPIVVWRMANVASCFLRRTFVVLVLTPFPIATCDSLISWMNSREKTALISSIACVSSKIYFFYSLVHHNLVSYRACYVVYKFTGAKLLTRTLN